MSTVWKYVLNGGDGFIRHNHLIPRIPAHLFFQFCGSLGDSQILLQSSRPRMDRRVIGNCDQQTPVANYKICYLVSQSTSRRYNEDSVINFYYELNSANKINHGDRIPTFIPRVINHLTIYLHGAEPVLPLPSCQHRPDWLQQGPRGGRGQGAGGRGSLSSN